MSSDFSEAVLDASILIQTLVKEKYTNVALRLVSLLKAIYVPSLVFYEIGNALVILARKSLITKEDAIRKLNHLNAIPTLTAREVTYSKAMELAIELEITLYDASYLTLALQTDAPLITADRELYEKGKTTTKMIHASEVVL